MHSNVLSIILYGSHARNDNNANSDYDICIFTKKLDGQKLTSSEINNLCKNSQHLQITPIYYQESLVDDMLEYGSLFLWHLKLEGKILFGKKYFLSKIKKLKPFISHHSEILYHKELFSDLNNYLDCIFLPNEFDLSLLFTIARNTCMLLAHKRGNPTFGRLSCYAAAKKLFPDLPIEKKEYLYLSKFKNIYERGTTQKYNLPSESKFKKFIVLIDNLLKYALKKTE